jgi:hypothetical protein
MPGPLFCQLDGEKCLGSPEVPGGLGGEKESSGGWTGRGRAPAHVELTVPLGDTAWRYLGGKSALLASILGVWSRTQRWLDRLSG